MYYFAPKNPQNNKSSIVGQRLDVTIFEDFLNTAPVKKKKIKKSSIILAYNCCIICLLMKLFNILRKNIETV